MSDLTYGENEVVNISDINTLLVGETQNAIDINIELMETHAQNAPDSVELHDQFYMLFQNKSLFELSKASWSCINQSSFRDGVQPYLRGCKWSPDGTCCLSIVNNNGMHLTELSTDLYNSAVSGDRPVNYLQSVVHVKEAGLIYDFCWYPGMQSISPETSCWLTTRQNGPIQLWDAFDGSLRCSYRGFNAVDEMEPALSVTFSADGSQVYAGYKKCLKVFSTDRPGRSFDEHKVKYSATSLATSCASPNLLAVGSWNTSINILSVKEGGTFKSMGNLHGHSGGVTHMKFLPDGMKLVSGGRKDDKLIIWDLRYHQRPYKILKRTVNTNQRIYFDVSPCGRYLVSGGTNGILLVWDMAQESEDSTVGGISEFSKYSFPVNSDCCNGVSFHPCRPIVATASGQYHTRDPVDQIDNSSDSDNDMEVSDNERTKQNIDLSNEYKKTVDDIRSKTLLDCDIENSLIFWWIGNILS